MELQNHKGKESVMLKTKKKKALPAVLWHYTTGMKLQTILQEKVLRKKSPDASNGKGASCVF